PRSTSTPCFTQLAIVPPEFHSLSSGCAYMASAVLISRASSNFMRSSLESPECSARAASGSGRHEDRVLRLPTRLHDLAVRPAVQCRNDVGDRPRALRRIGLVFVGFPPRRHGGTELRGQLRDGLLPRRTQY